MLDVTSEDNALAHYYDGRNLVTTKSLNSTGVVLIVMGFMCLISWISYALVTPKIYLSNATVQIVYPRAPRPEDDVTLLNQLTLTQVELMRSEATLTQTLHNLNLQERWQQHFRSPLSQEDLIYLLRRSVRIEPVAKTIGLISVKAFRHNPEEAAEIATAIVTVYRDMAATNPQQSGPYEIRIVNPAVPSQGPDSPRFILDIAVALIGWITLAGAGTICLAVARQKK